MPCEDPTPMVTYAGFPVENGRQSLEEWYLRLQSRMGEIVATFLILKRRIFHDERVPPDYPRGPCDRSLVALKQQRDCRFG